MPVLQKYVLELTVFACGAIVMIYELVGSRVLGPYLGTSIIVWTSLIGVILGSLSLGYYLGGYAADRRGDISHLGIILLLASVSVLLTAAFKEQLLGWLAAFIVDIRILAVVSSVLLFLPASVLLGMVSPYAAKLRLNALATSGLTIGRLYALSTVGSIAGTFAAGFYLIPLVGTTLLLFILSAALAVIASVLLMGTAFEKKSVCIVLIIAGSFILASADKALSKDRIDVDTAYNRIWIYPYRDHATDRLARVMRINNENHSSMFLDNDDLANEYTKYYHLARHFYPSFSTTLMLGGGGYSFPKNAIDRYPNATMDVVEIDSGVTALARMYFRLLDNPRLTIIHEDARVFLNRTEKKYDVIFGDAFNSQSSLPYQLTTRQALRRMHDMLNENGVFIVNIISGLSGEKSTFLRAELATMKEQFPHVVLFKVPNAATDNSGLYNLILVALKSDHAPSFETEDPELRGYLDNRILDEILSDMPILTDDYAPVEYYISRQLL